MVNSRVWQVEHDFWLIFRVSLKVEHGLVSGRMHIVDSATTVEVRMQRHETVCLQN